MTLGLRAATPADEPFLVEMLLLAAFPPGAETPSVDRAREDERLARYIVGWGRSSDVGVIAESAEEPIGAAWYRHFSAAAPGHGFVNEAVPEVTIAVQASWRRRGFGRALLTALIDEARRHGESSLSLSVSRRNPIALRLYRSVGFREVAGGREHPTMLLELPGPTTLERGAELDPSQASGPPSSRRDRPGHRSMSVGPRVG